MVAVREIRISAKGGVRSLVWNGDELIDWASGGTRFLLSGETVPNSVYYPYSFDAAVMSPSGEFAVIYTRLGTKGLVLRRGKIVREINRSYYHAGVYEYPVAIARLNDGREVLIHCPQEYCRLEIEELGSGRRLTERSSRKPGDFFHSRLAASPDGRTLLSAGWIWHPVDDVRVFDIEAALQDASQLDGLGFGIDAWADESSAAFDCDGRVVVVLNGIESQGEDGHATSTSLVEIRTFEPRISSAARTVHRHGRLGTVMPVGTGLLLGLYEFPRLIDSTTGDELQNWPHIHSGRQTSSILLDSEPSLPAIALDPVRRRCAIADSEGITVLRFDV
jgi:hypothetical protein